MAANGGKGLIDPEGPRRCDNCEHSREREGLGDFICRHIRGYKEAPAHVRKCNSCDRWKKDNFVKGDFWCRHNKYRKREWDREQGW